MNISYDNYTVADLHDILNQDLDPKSEEMSKLLMPIPWHGIISDFFAASMALETNYTRFYTKHGLLQAKVDWRRGKHPRLLRYIVRGLTLSCCDICIICGSIGYRRRGELNSPTLCDSHYIEYINYLDGEMVYVPRGRARKLFTTNVYESPSSRQISLPFDE